MHDPLPGGAHLLFPLVASLVYVAAVLMSKRAVELGCGVWRPTVAANLASAVLFAPLWLLGGRLPEARLWYQPVVVGVFFLLGQSTTYLALRRGDVSVATPVLGLKIPLVAVLTTLLGVQPPTPRLWLAAALACAAVALLTGGAPARRGGLWVGVAAAAGAALSFAMFDVLVQRWSPAWGTGRFLPIMFGLVAAMSLALTPIVRETPWSAPPASRRWLAGGGLLMALQALCLVTALSWFGQAVPMNVVYSTRSLWSVIAVWAVGHWFANAEQNLGWRVLRWRLAGALLMMSAVALALS